ncbi:MAG TPA: hypothetical protein VGO80_17615 [Solirubrobacteraceae bacterium]|nr:hypothetical protein [Solirubrobacteraceae bacterium]
MARRSKRGDPAPAPTPAVPAPPAGEPAGGGPLTTDGARSALEIAGLIVAPPAFVTALAFYFGWTLTAARASYYAIDVSALGFSTQDYLLRSTDALFVPLVAGLAVALGAVTLHAAVVRDLQSGQRRHLLLLTARIAVALGGTLFGLGLVGMFERLAIWPSYLWAPASPGIGVALLAYGLYLLGRLSTGIRARAPSGRRARLDVALVVIMVVLSAFRTASVYADALGRGRAMGVAQNLGARPAVTVFSARRLHLTGVAEQELDGRDSAYRYRYAGLRMLIRSGGKYFLLPDGWIRGRGAAIVLSDGPSLRFEFGSGAT